MDSITLTDANSEEMDMQLLLAVQKVCNTNRQVIDWDAVGAQLAFNNSGVPITGSAVQQHLAKLRGRRMKAGLWVPAPLRKGGNNYPVGTRQTASTYSRGAGRSTNSGNMSGTKRVKLEDSSDDDFDVDDVTDPDGSYDDSRRAKRMKKDEIRSGKPENDDLLDMSGGKRAIKKEADVEEADVKDKSYRKKGKAPVKNKQSKTKRQVKKGKGNSDDEYVGLGAGYMKLEGLSQDMSWSDITDDNSVADAENGNDGGLVSPAESKFIFF